MTTDLYSKKASTELSNKTVKNALTPQSKYQAPPIKPIRSCGAKKKQTQGTNSRCKRGCGTTENPAKCRNRESVQLDRKKT